MLSILIPVYNFDVRDFVQDLHRQAVHCDIDFEILCYDDCSDSTYKDINRTLESLDKVIYKELPENIGRSKIRNMLANDSQYEYLLVMDCDSKTCTDNFIRNYVENISPRAIVYGGRSYEPTPPADLNKYLRWHYGTERESMPFEERRKDLYRSFMTNNLLIPKTIYQSIKMNEDLIGYGHEDTAFGTVLRGKKIPVIHIDNPLCHIGLEDANEFIAKTNEGLKNLAWLINNGLVDEDVKLYRYYKRIKGWGTKTAFLSIFRKRKKKMLENLHSPKPSLRTFDLYKLGLLVELMDE